MGHSLDTDTRTNAYTVETFIIPLCGIVSFRFIRLTEYFIFYQHLHMSSGFHTEKFRLFSSHLVNQSDKLHCMSVTDVFLQPVQISLPYVLFLINVHEL